MEKLIWNDSLSVGVPEIDEQHKQLVQMLNQMIEADDTSVRSEVISDILTRMTEYADYHFTTEEAYMQAYSYPEYEAHRDQHVEFMRKTAQLALAAMDYDKQVPEELLTYLKDWLITHIMQSDMKYKPYFVGKPSPR
jgi:hemerythrin